jgi:hypothetical protein
MPPSARRKFVFSITLEAHRRPPAGSGHAPPAGTFQDRNGFQIGIETAIFCFAKN